jgi:hypothetical protein
MGGAGDVARDGVDGGCACWAFTKGTKGAKNAKSANDATHVATTSAASASQLRRRSCECGRCEWLEFIAGAEQKVMAR